MFGFNSRSSGWSSIADCVDHRVIPLGNCSVLKTNKRRQYEEEYHVSGQSDSKTETIIHSGCYDRLCNTDQFLGRVSHVSLRVQQAFNF